MDPIPHPPLPGLVPAWLDRVAQFSWRVLVALAAIALLFAIFATVPLVLIPVVLAVILAATLEPLVLALVRRGWSRARAAGIAVGGGFLVIVGVLLLSVAVLVQEAASIAETTASGAESASASLGGQLALPASAVAGAGREIVSAVAAMADGAVTLAVITLLATLLTFYFIRDGGRLWARLTVRIRPEVSPEISAAARRAFDVLGGYMFGTAVISFVGAASQLVIMLVLGLPLALPVFVLSFFLNFIPYIGGFISTGVAFLIAIAVGSPMDVVIMGIWTIAFNLVTGNIVSPIVYGRTVHIHPAIVLVAIPAAATIAGMLGMFIVVPVLGVVAATWRTVLAVMGSHVEPDAARTAPPPGPEVTADVPTPAPGAT